MGEAPLVCTLLYAKKKCNNRIFMLAFCTVCGTFITHNPVAEANAKMWEKGAKGDGWFWQKFYSVHRTWPDTTFRSDFKTRHLRHAQTAKLWHHPDPPTKRSSVQHDWRKSTPNEKKKTKHYTERNARKRQHVFYFLCYFSTASASVTSCFLAPPIYGLLRRRQLIVSQL